MRGVALLYTLLACSVAIFGDVNVCSDKENEALLRHEDCNKFYKCTGGQAVEHRCNGDLFFNSATLHCESPQNVNCDGRSIPTDDSRVPKLRTARSVQQKTRKPGFLPNGCPETHIHWLLPHETNCSLFYYCVWGNLVLRECPAGTHFNRFIQNCDWPQNAKCTSVTQANSNPTTPLTTLTTLPSSTTTELTTPKPTTPEPTTSATTKPEFLPNGCPVNPHIHWLLPHETDCTLFYYCVWGELVLRQCAPGTHFNSILQVCDWPQNANCSTSTPSTTVPTTSQSTTLEPTTPQPTNQPTTSEPITSEITTLAPTTSESPTAEPTTPAPTKPEFLPNGCPVNPHIHWLLPHETDCTLFYYCVWGELVLRQCAPGTHFNSILQVCDWPQNANCSTSTPTSSQPTTLEPTTPEPTTSEVSSAGPTTSKPITSEITTLAPTTSEPPTTEPTTVCDWPQNANCSTSTPTSSQPTTLEPTTPESTTSEVSSAGPTTSETIIPEITTLAPTTSELPTTEPTTSAPTKPEFLPNGCPVNPHIHWLLPHETDCTLFYYCVWGELVLRQCAPGTHFNSILQVCDWPHNANCSTSTSSTTAPTTPQSTTLEPTTPQPTNQPTTTEPITSEITTLAPTISEPPTTEPTTSAPTKPEFLPNGCPVNPHIHWLLPHETDCTLFYYCVWGELVLRQCAPGTHFNSILQVCDWPHNANCSTSTSSTTAPTTPQSTTLEPTTPQPTNQPTTTEPITSEITTLAPTISEPPTTEPTTSAPTKPEFLPNGCPVNPHIHWLLPHETDCTLFYYCVWGELVLRQCAPGTHFNSILQVCDWPHNANCSTSTSSTTAPTTPQSTTLEPTTPQPTNQPTTTEPITSEITTLAPTISEPPTTEPTTSAPTKPEFLPNGCPVNPHIHWLLPHETDCTLFYYCVWGELVLRQCAPGTHFNSILQVCDWPHNANCSTSTSSTTAPTTPQSTTLEPTTPQPTNQPTTTEPITSEITTLAPTTSEPPTTEPTTVCDWPQNANCSTSTPTSSQPTTLEPTTPESTTSEVSSAGPTTSETIIPEITTLAPTTSEPPTTEPTTSAPTKPEFLPNGCPVNPHIHWLLPHETDCTLFYYCVWGELVLRQCAPGTHFNSILQVCDWPQNANCSTSTSSTTAPTTPQSTTLEPTTPQPTNQPTTTEPITSEITTLAPTTSGPPTTEPTTSAPTKPEFLPNGCPVNPHIHWLLPHETDCTLFYYCVWGELVLRQCAPGTHFNSVLQVCDWPQNANCSTATPSTIEPTTLQPTTPGLTTLEPTTTELTTLQPTTSEASSAGTTTSEPITPEITTLAPTTPEPTTPAPAKPEFLLNGCPVNPHIHWLLPHETDCTLFYYCVWGELVLRQCGPGTHFNKVLQICDWPQDANCTTSSPSTPKPTTSQPTTPEQTTSGLTTSVPITTEIITQKLTTTELLPNGCPANPHIPRLLPHETDCTLFYQCVWGNLVLMHCGPGTYFNRTVQVCDWPQNAGCTAALNKQMNGRIDRLSL